MITYLFEPSGQLKVPSEQELKDIDIEVAIICYTNGTTEDGRPYYAYVAVTPSKYMEFHRMTAARNTIVLNEYGRIVAGGFEAKPPPDVIRKMREDYGYDEHFAQKLKDEVTRQRGTFSTNQEEKRLMDIVSMLKATKKT
jgi:hypothetical protein